MSEAETETETEAEVQIEPRRDPEVHVRDEHRRIAYHLRMALGRFEDDLRKELLVVSRTLDLGQHYALTVLLKEGPQSVNALAKKINMQQPTTSKLVDRLIERELVTKGRDGKDKRVVYVSLTTSGEIVAKALMDAEDNAEAATLDRHGAFRRIALMRTLLDGLQEGP